MLYVAFCPSKIVASHFHFYYWSPSAKPTLSFLRERYFPDYLPRWSNLANSSVRLSMCFIVDKEEAAYDGILSLFSSRRAGKMSARKTRRDPTLASRIFARRDPPTSTRARSKNRRFFRVHWPFVNAGCIGMRALYVHIYWTPEKAQFDVSWLLDLGDPIASHSTVASSSSTICRGSSRRSSTIDADDRSYEHICDWWHQNVYWNVNFKSY